MHVASLRVVGFRNLAGGQIVLGEGMTLLCGPNGAGKSNVLEALCLALTGRSPRTRREREAIAFDADLARIEVTVVTEDDATTFEWSIDRSGDRRHRAGGSPAADAVNRPRIGLFDPDRLALVKGPPGVRRSYVDRACATRWPARGAARRAYGQALAQRNALLARVRAGVAARSALDPWDLRLAEAGAQLIAARTETIEAIAPAFAEAARELGLADPTSVAYRPRSEATVAAALAGELRERRNADVARGYSAHGPHLDDIAISAGGRSLRSYGSQGEQRTAVLALLLAEREMLIAAGRPAPLMLLDDVMSELDPERRALLAGRLSGGGGQSVLTATETAELPASCARLEVRLVNGAVVERSRHPGPDMRLAA